MRAPLPGNEVERLLSLKDYQILDTEVDPHFDQIVELASEICEVPIALVSLVDTERQWFKASCGLDAKQTPREQAFCAHALLSTEPLIVPDATLDPRFRDNPLVTGEPYVCFYTGIPLVNAEGYILGTLCVIDGQPRQLNATQMHSLKHLANLTINLMEQYRLQQKLQSNQVALKELSQQAAKANRAKSEFLANMSHEIRTPINAVMGLSYLLQKTDLTQQQGDYVAKIQTASENLLGVINAILDISKIEAQKLELESIPFDLDKTLNSLISILGIKARQQGLELIFDVSASVPRLLYGDPLRLEQVLMNLLSNAIKFTPAGKVILSISTQANTAESTTLYFKVMDTGVGMSEAQRKKLFQAFSQADLSTTRQYGGTGLGLSIASHLVRLMAGEIVCQSAPGKGSTFSFHADFRRQEPGLPAFKSLGDLTVLLIENQKMQAKIFMDYLRHFGMKVTLIETAEEALGICSHYQSHQQVFDMILVNKQILDNASPDFLRQVQSLMPPSDCIYFVLGTDEEPATVVQGELYFSKLRLPITQSALYDQLVSKLDVVQKQAQAQTLDNQISTQAKRVLLVEDNQINREIAKNILEFEGLLVDVAIHGKEAVEILKAGLPACNYDLVLMDLHMPEMDGYQATQIIRENLGIKIPIIAMTADVISGVRERVLAVGMDDYLTKPIVIDILSKTLNFWLGEGPQKSPVETLVPDGSVLGLEQIRGLDLDSALLRMQGDSALLVSLLRRFCFQHLNFVSTLKNHLQTDLEAAKAELHLFKGSAGNLGLRALFEAAQLLESQVRVDTDISEALSQMNQELTLLIQDVAHYLPAPKDQEKGPFDREAFSIQAHQVLQEITHFDPSALQSLETLLLQAGPYQTQLRGVFERVEAFEYMEAEQLLHDLLDQVQLDIAQAEAQ